MRQEIGQLEDRNLFAVRELQTKELELDRERQKNRDIIRENEDNHERIADLEREVNRLQQDVTDYRGQLAKQKERLSHGRGDTDLKAVVKVCLIACSCIHLDGDLWLIVGKKCRN